MKKLSPTLIGRILFTWITFVIISMSFLISNSSDDKTFFRFGPHPDFKILSIEINNSGKYTVIVLYALINSIFRALVDNYLHTWMINNIQDESKDKSDIKNIIVYELNTYIVFYRWFDWLLYMNILLSQIDMMFIELFGDLFITYITSAYYLRKIPNNIENVEIIETII